jgi:hypothetical protein
MQIPLVMMLALSGLGCQNGASTVIDAPPLPGHRIDAPPLTSSQGNGGAITNYSGSFASSAYPEIGARVYDRYSTAAEPLDWHTGFRYTLYSFVWGRDPNVSTAREIEASVYGYQTEH